MLESCAQQQYTIHGTTKGDEQVSQQDGTATERPGWLLLTTDVSDGRTESVGQLELSVISVWQRVVLRREMEAVGFTA